MQSWKSHYLYQAPHEHPYQALTTLFAIWKTFLFFIAVLAPGEGYDTSTAILLRRSGVQDSSNPVSFASVVSKFVRWDAVYFAEVASRGYVFEQEWAFSWGFTRLISAVTKVFGTPSSNTIIHGFTGIILANISHYLSALILHQLVLSAFPSLSHPSKKNIASKLAFLTASLHVLSPAGLFLSAPYGESLFSLLNFSGFLFYLEGKKRSGLPGDAQLLVSGVFFALSTAVRSNGLLSAAVYLYDVAIVATAGRAFLSSWRLIRRLLCTGLAGLVVAAGSVVPQWIAYNEYCVTGSAKGAEGKVRPWCRKLPPSIYSFVQDHYWNVGFLRYWTLSNAPLFLLAAPMLYILARSSLQTALSVLPSKHNDKALRTSAQEDGFVRRLAVPQAILAVLAFTSFHVQIINRIASGYPFWYMSIAASLLGLKNVAAFSGKQAKWIVYWMIMYSIIQGALYASFLPPA